MDRKTEIKIDRDTTKQMESNYYIDINPFACIK